MVCGLSSCDAWVLSVQVSVVVARGLSSCDAQAPENAGSVFAARQAQ